MFLKIAFKNLLRNKRRTLFTEVAIVFGVVVIVFTGAFLRGMFRNWVLMQADATLGSFQIEHRDYREKGTLDPLRVTLENSQALIEEVEQVPGIVSAYGELRMTGIVSNGSSCICRKLTRPCGFRKVTVFPTVISRIWTF